MKNPDQSKSGQSSEKLNPALVNSRAGFNQLYNDC